MLYWWLQQSPFLDHHLARASTGDSHVYLTARAALATAVAFFLALVLGPFAIRWLKARFRERVDSASARLNELHAAKNATPTMGGIFIVAAIGLAACVCGDLSNSYLQQGLVVTVAYGLLGAYDDWVKARTHRRGLKARHKLLGQLLLGLIITGWLGWAQRTGVYHMSLVWPLGNVVIPLGLFYLLWGVLVQVGASNGVNLTDGLDGLATGCLLFCGGALLILTYVAGHRVFAEYLSIPYEPGVGELCILLGALMGAALGFLWFNCYPAQVFMGDTGSLPTGALLGYCALAIHQEFLLLVAGGVFVAETLSVMAQVGWFKFTGKRILACSPLHNHYLFQGQHEIKIVVRFWIAAAILALMAVGCLKIH